MKKRMYFLLFCLAGFSLYADNDAVKPEKVQTFKRDDRSPIINLISFPILYETLPAIPQAYVYPEAYFIIMKSYADGQLTQEYYDRNNDIPEDVVFEDGEPDTMTVYFSPFLRTLYFQESREGDYIFAGGLNGIGKYMWAPQIPEKFPKDLKRGGNIIPTGTKEFRIVYRFFYPNGTLSDLEYEITLDTSELWD